MFLNTAPTSMTAWRPCGRWWQSCARLTLEEQFCWAKPMEAFEQTLTVSKFMKVIKPTVNFQPQINAEQRSRNQVWYVRINRKDTKSAKKEPKEVSTLRS